MLADFPDSLRTWLIKRASSNCHRQLLVIQGPEAWCLATAQALLNHQNFQQVLWSGNRQPGHCMEHSAYRQYLGMEFDAVVFNAHSGVRANAMMSLSGTVKARGLMLLLCPDLSNWSATVDPERVKRTSYGYGVSRSPSLFIEWLVDRIQADPLVAQLRTESFSGQLSPIDSSGSEQSDFCQTDVVEAIVNLRNQPLVVTADRGRGKSSALGLAAARLMRQQDIKIVVTAPAPRAVSKVFEHAGDSLSVTNHQKNFLSVDGAELEYVAIDLLASTFPPADLIMIDEAAAIPNALLKKLQGHYKTIVYSTTVHGYEGTGRGFEIRFNQYLKDQFSGWKTMHLNQPMRWSMGDALEKFWFDVMLMNDQFVPKSIAPVTSSKLTYLALSREELKDFPALLSQVFQLMIDAHYQTVPDDLVRLLDAPDQRIFVACSDDTVLAVMLVCLEGGQRLKDIANDISQGLRRPTGHLVAQNLAYAFASPTLATASYLRISRIAVSSEYQRQGIASGLIDTACAYAKRHHLNFLSTSYGLHNSLLNFWATNQFCSVKLGTKKDASSGEYSIMMLRPLDEYAETTLKSLQVEFDKEMRYQTSVMGLDIETQWLDILLAKAEANTPSSHMMPMLNQFCEGSRPLDSCERLIHEYIGSLAEEARDSNQDAINFLSDRVSLGKDIAQICKEYHLTGKKALVAHARKSLRQLIQYDNG